MDVKRFHGMHNSERKMSARMQVDFNNEQTRLTYQMKDLRNQDEVNRNQWATDQVAIRAQLEEERESLPSARIALRDITQEARELRTELTWSEGTLKMVAKDSEYAE
jgi:hypothetical protein